MPSPFITTYTLHGQPAWRLHYWERQGYCTRSFKTEAAAEKWKVFRQRLVPAHG